MCLILRVSCFYIIRHSDCDVPAWDGTHCRGPTVVRGSNGTQVTDLSTFRFFSVCGKEGGNWNWEYRTGTGANWHFTWRLTTNCPPAGTSVPTESDACLTGSVCEVYISPPHSTPCDSLHCTVASLSEVDYQSALVKDYFFYLWCFFFIVPNLSGSCNFEMCHLNCV